MLTVQEKDYQLEYSESYLGNVHVELTIEGLSILYGPEKSFWVIDIRTI